MCGIVGITHKSINVSGDILQSLKRLEYRGYDSSGIAIISDDAKLKLVKEVGKIHNLSEVASKTNLMGKVGLGHTRWATHGKVCQENSHPHTSGHVAVVHNGIIENYVELKEYLISQGEVFASETDTEVIPVFINFLLKNGETFEDAFIEVIKRLKGAYAIAAICTYKKDIIAVAKNHSPLVVGFGQDLSIVGSDAFSIISLANKMVYLNDGDYGFVNADGKLSLFDIHGHKVEREIVTSNLNTGSIGKDGYKHYMLKEIHEQPTILRSLFNGYFNLNDGKIILPNIEKINLNKYKRVKIIACGTSYYAGYATAYFFEKYAKMNCDIYIASEYRYKNLVVESDTLYIAISQSGETADTIGAIKVIKELGGDVVAIVNNEESTIEFISNLAIKCHAGPEIGVASTKVFTSQVLAIMALSFAIALERNTIKKEEFTSICHEIDKAIINMSHLLNNNEWIQNISNIANIIQSYHSLIYLGRGIGYPVAMEGSLKLKELSYIHSEAMASGELKHGSIALIDKNIPVITLAPTGCLFDKNSSNIENIFSRDGRIVLISDTKGINYFNKFSSQILGNIEVPVCADYLVPLIYSLPVQLLAYYTSLAKGNDVDQPRNLAKSVTVE